MSTQNRRLYFAHVRLLALVSLTVAVVLIVVGAPVAALWIVAVALGLLWGVLTYLRMRWTPNIHKDQDWTPQPSPPSSKPATGETGELGGRRHRRPVGV